MKEDEGRAKEAVRRGGKERLEEGKKETKKPIVISEELQAALIKDRSVEEVYDIILSTLLDSNEAVTIHEATRKADGKKVVVRKMQATPENTIEIELGLIDMYRTLSHPCIIKHNETYFDEAQNTIYTILEYPEGGWKVLFDRVVELGHLSEKSTIYVVKQIASMLEFLHSQNIAHRTLRVCTNND